MDEEILLERQIKAAITPKKDRKDEIDKDLLKLIAQSINETNDLFVLKKVTRHIGVCIKSDDLVVQNLSLSCLQYLMENCEAHFRVVVGNDVDLLRYNYVLTPMKRLVELQKKKSLMEEELNTSIRAFIMLRYDWSNQTLNINHNADRGRMDI